MVMIGIIGGSGMDDPKLLQDYERVDIITPYGRPSSPITKGKLNGVDVAILARHGHGHKIMPTNVNSRANIYALKEMGCTHIIATTAVGSLKEDVAPGHLVFLDQFIDRTGKRHQTFYDKNQVCHIAMGDPFCNQLREILVQSAETLGITHHKKGTVITIEGPRFSTKAESRMFQSWGGDVINMSTVPEVVLAREAGLCYASIAMSTDYDCWKDNNHVTWEEIVKVMGENAERVKRILLHAIPRIAYEVCSCRDAIKYALV